MTRFLFWVTAIAIVLTTAAGSSSGFAQCYHAASGYPEAFHTYYPLDAGAGDVTGTAPGVAVGGAAFGAGWVALDGVGDYIVLPLPMSSVDGFSGVTVEGWVNRSLPATVDTIYYEGTAGVASLSLAISAGGALSLTVRSVIAAPEVAAPTVFTSTRPLPTETWVHVAATVDLAAKSYVLYANGVPVQSTGADMTVMGAFAIASTDVTIGTAIDGGGAVMDPFFGGIDEITVFNRVLSRGEIAGIFEAGRLPLPGKCRADADLDLVMDPVDNCPLAVNPAQVDSDFDGSGDACDVLPFFAGCFAAPERVHVWFDGPGMLSWSPVNAFGGVAPIVYDVLEGSYPPRAPVGTAPEACLADDIPALGLAVAAIPAPGTAARYLLRAENACGVGSYGVTSAGAPRLSPVCPL